MTFLSLLEFELKTFRVQNFRRDGFATSISNCLPFEKSLEPVDREFGVSFQAIFVIHIVETKSNGVTEAPFKVVQQ